MRPGDAHFVGATWDSSEAICSSLSHSVLPETGDVAQVPAMGGISLVALGLAMLGVGGVDLREQRNVRRFGQRRRGGEDRVRDEIDPAGIS